MNPQTVSDWLQHFSTSRVTVSAMVITSSIVVPRKVAAEDRVTGGGV